MIISNSHDPSLSLLSTIQETMSKISITRMNEVVCTKSTNDDALPVPGTTATSAQGLDECTSTRTIERRTPIDDDVDDESPIHKIPDDNDLPSKRVHFAVDDGSDGDQDCQDKIGAPSLWTTLTRDVVEELWYQQEEIASMKAEAKYYILHRKGATADQVCGLDRFTSQRALWKRSAIQYVLMSQRHNRGDEFIRRVSLRCSGWFREKACEQGFRDYCAVHDPLASLLESDSVENYNECFFSHTGLDDAMDGDNGIADANTTKNNNISNANANEDDSLKRSSLKLDEDNAENEQPGCKRQRSL
jgi:hypothetical protein